MIMNHLSGTGRAADIRQKLAYLRFDRLPAAYIHPQRLNHYLPANLPHRLRDRLLYATRLQPRLSSFLAKRFDLQPCARQDFDMPEGRFAQLEGEKLGMTVRRIGAVWHGRSIAAIILADALKELIAWLGQDGYRAALRHGKLANQEVDREVIGDEVDIERLCQMIERDGQRCVSAWCRHQPASLAARLLLKFPPVADVDEEPEEAFRDLGLLITDRVIMEMAAGDGNVGR